MNVKNTFIDFGALDPKLAGSFARQSTEPASKPTSLHDLSSLCGVDGRWMQPAHFAQTFPGRQDPQQQALAECEEDAHSESLDLGCEAGAFHQQVTEYEFGPRPVSGLRTQPPWPFAAQPSPNLSALPPSPSASQMMGALWPEAQGAVAPPPPEWAGKTSVMLRNLHRDYTQRALLEEMNQSGFVGSYDFFYLPIDKGTGGNKGYSFINFSDPATAWRFKQAYDGRTMAHSSDKLVSVMPAVLQGFDANYAHYSSSRVMRGDPSCRPLFFRTPGPETEAGLLGSSRRATPNALGLATLAKAGGQRKGPGRLEQLVESQRREELIQQAVNQLATTVVQQQMQQKRGQLLEQEGPSTCAPEAGGSGASRCFCFSCGSKLSPGFQFCPNCGTNLAA